MEQAFFPVTRREAERQGVPFSSDANKNALFPSQLKELREGKGISQAVLARALGVSKSTIGLWETGDTLPDAKSLHDIATFFGVSANYLLGFTKDMGMVQTATEDLGLSHDAVMEIKNLGFGKLKNAFNLFVTDPDFVVFLYTLREIVESSKLHRKDELTSQYGPPDDDWEMSGEMKYDAEEYARKKLSASDAMVIYGDLLIELLKYKANKSLNEIICGLIAAGRTEAEAESTRGGENE